MTAEENALQAEHERLAVRAQRQVLRAGFVVVVHRGGPGVGARIAERTGTDERLTLVDGVVRTRVDDRDGVAHHHIEGVAAHAVVIIGANVIAFVLTVGLLVAPETLWIMFPTRATYDSALFELERAFEIIRYGVEPVRPAPRIPKLPVFRPSERASTAPVVIPKLCPKKRRREMGRIMRVSWPTAARPVAALSD